MSKSPVERVTNLGHDCLVLWVSCLVLTLAFVLVERSDGRIAPRGLSRLTLPEICMSRACLGWNCPACGLTRSIIHLAQGDWRVSWHDHRLGVLTALLIVLQVPYRLMCLSQSAHWWL